MGAKFLNSMNWCKNIAVGARKYEKNGILRSADSSVYGQVND